MELSIALINGGKASRSKGLNKAHQAYQGVKVIQQLPKFKPYFNQHLVISYHVEDELADYQRYEDIYPNLGPLGGIYTALVNCVNEACLCLASDTPLINELIITSLIAAYEPNTIIVASTDDGLEPLCAIYPKSLSNEILTCLNNHDLRLQAFIKQHKYKIVSFEDKSLFKNCNYLEDWSK